MLLLWLYLASEPRAHGAGGGSLRAGGGFSWEGLFRDTDARRAAISRAAAMVQLSSAGRFFLNELDSSAAGAGAAGHSADALLDADTAHGSGDAGFLSDGLLPRKLRLGFENENELGSSAAGADAAGHSADALLDADTAHGSGDAGFLSDSDGLLPRKLRLGFENENELGSSTLTEDVDGLLLLLLLLLMMPESVVSLAPVLSTAGWVDDDIACDARGVIWCVLR
jgi:hypothetical protein